MYQKIPDTLSQAFFIGEESLATKTKDKKSREDSEALLEQISAWLWTKAEGELLQEFLVMLQHFKSEQAMAQFLGTQKEVAARQVPLTPLAKALDTQMSQAKPLTELFEQIKNAFDKGNFSETSSLLSQLATLLLTSDPTRFPGYLNQSLANSMSGLLLQGKPGEKISDLLLKLGLASKAIELKKEGMTGEELSETLSSFLEGIACNVPPTLFADSAQKLDSDQKTALIKRFILPEVETDDLEKQLEALLKEVKDKIEVKLSLATTNKMLNQETSPTHRVDAYLKSCSDDQAKNALKAVINPLVFSTFSELVTLCKQLVPYSPDLSGDLQVLSALLQQALPPTASNTAKMRATLSALFQKLTKLSQLKELPQEIKEQFLSQLSALLDHNLQAIEEGELQGQKEITDLETESEEIAESMALISSFTQNLQRGAENEALTFPEIQENIQTLFQIIGNYRALPEDKKSLFHPFFDSLASMKMEEKPLVDILTTGSTVSWLREFSRNKPGGSIDDFNAFMEGKLASLKLVQTDHPFLEELSQRFSDLTTQPHFPVVDSQLGPSFMTEEMDLIAPNPHLPKIIEKAFIPKSDEVNSIAQVSEQSQANLQVTHDENKAKIEGTQKALKATQEVKNETLSAKSDTQLKIALTGSLPDDFMRIIMTFMNIQTGKIMSLADLLAAYNDGSSIFNKIIDLISSFDGSSKTLDLVTWLKSIRTKEGLFKDSKNPDLFNSLRDKATALLTELVKAVSALLPHGSADIESYVKDLQDKLAKAKAKGRQDLVDAYQDMLDTLTPLVKVNPQTGKTVLQTILDSLNSLKSYLSHLKAVHKLPETTPPSMVIEITDDQGQPLVPPQYLDFEHLIQLQDAVLEGDTGTPPFYPSLQDFYDTINTALSKYSNISQQQQIKLQMTMSTINQEWSLVATCMQSLFQMYTTLAQGIFPH